MGKALSSGGWYENFNSICMKYVLLITLISPFFLKAQIQKIKEVDSIYGSKYITYKLKGREGDLLPITLTKYKRSDDGPNYEFSFVQEISLQQYLRTEQITSIELMLKDGAIVSLNDEQLKLARIQVSFTGNGYKAQITSLLTKELMSILQKAKGIRANQYGEGLKFYDDPNGEDAKEFLALVKFFKSEIFDNK